MKIDKWKTGISLACTVYIYCKCKGSSCIPFIHPLIFIKELEVRLHQQQVLEKNRLPSSSSSVTFFVLVDKEMSPGQKGNTIASVGSSS